VSPNEVGLDCYKKEILINFNILDFKLSPCPVCCILSSG
jgi:hypothetical protein